VLNTLIGAGVGVAFNLIYPPAMPARPAGRAVIRVAEAAAAPLDAAGEALAAGPINGEQVASWLDRSRTAARRVADANDSIRLLRESRPFNPRALGTVDTEPVLTTGLDNLEHCLLAIRNLFLVLRSELPDAEEQPTRTGTNCAPPSRWCCTMSATVCAPSAAWSSPRPRTGRRRPNRPSPRAWTSSARPTPS
jgi:hypothetical protein